MANQIEKLCFLNVEERFLRIPNHIRKSFLRSPVAASGARTLERAAFALPPRLRLAAGRSGLFLSISPKVYEIGRWSKAQIEPHTKIDNTTSTFKDIFYYSVSIIGRALFDTWAAVRLGGNIGGLEMQCGLWVIWILSKSATPGNFNRLL